MEKDNYENSGFKKYNSFSISKLKINFEPVRLLNNIGDNVCWWNSFAQLFCSTRDMIIINTFAALINNTKNNHNCIDQNNNNNNNNNQNNNLNTSC
jgi:hypothetical protein